MMLNPDFYLPLRMRILVLNGLLSYIGQSGNLLPNKFCILYHSQGKDSLSSVSLILSNKYKVSLFYILYNNIINIGHVYMYLILFRISD